MNQKSIRFAQISFVLALISFLPAAIIYFTSINKIFDMPLEEALKISTTEKKPIFLMKPNLYNQKQKNFAKLINSNDELKKLFKDKFILAKFDKIDTSLTADFGKYAEMAISQMGLVVDWNSELIGFIQFDQEAPKLIKQLNILSSIDFLKWESTENSQIRAMSNGKPIMVIVSNSIFNNLEIADICSKPEELNYIKTNYNPSFISIKKNNEFSFAKNLLQKNNIQLKDLEGGSPLIFVLDKDMKLLKYGLLNYTKKSNSFQDFMKNEITQINIPIK